MTTKVSGSYDNKTVPHPLQENSLLGLPKELIHDSLMRLELGDILNVGLTGRDLRQITQDKDLWRKLSHRDFRADTSKRSLENSLSAYQHHYKLHLNITKGIYTSCTLSGHDDFVRDLVSIEERLISCSDDKTIKVWNVEEKTLLKTLTEHTGWVRAIAVDKGRLFSGSEDLTIKIWNMESWECIKTLHGHKTGVISFAIVDELLFSGSFDGEIRVWNIHTGECLDILQGHTRQVKILVAGNGMVFSGSYDHTIRVWDIKTRRCIQILEGHKGLIRALIFAHGKLFSAPFDGTIKVWDIHSWKCSNTLMDHKRNGIFLLAYDNGTIVSCSNNDVMKIWCAKKEICLYTFPQSEEGLYSLTFSEGKCISSSKNHSIKILDFNCKNSRSHSK